VNEKATSLVVDLRLRIPGEGVPSIATVGITGEELRRWVKKSEDTSSERIPYCDELFGRTGGPVNEGL
jgi:hypothetical protein